MKIALGCDHGALMLKNALIPFLQSMGHSVMDFGTFSAESCDYPDFAAAAAMAVADGDCDRGIVLCTTGIGVSIVANKIRGIRCALLSDINTARMTRLHNDTNMMALGASVVSQDLAFAIVETWLNTPFSNEDRHQRRIDKVMACERGLKKNLKRNKRKRKHSSLISKLLTFAISILLVLSLVITPIATFVTSLADPSHLVEILFSSGIFDNKEDPTEEPTGEPSGPADGGDSTDTPVDGGENTDTSTDEGNGDSSTQGGDPATDGEGSSSSSSGENTDTTAEGEGTDTSTGGESTDTPAGDENTDTSTGDESADTPAGDENTDTSTGDEGADAPADDNSSALDFLGALKDAFGSDMMDEDTLHTLLEIPAETPIDMELLGAQLAESDAAQALLSAYVSDTMDAAMGIEREPSLTSDTVMDIVNPHISELTSIVLDCLPEGTEVDAEALENATRKALQTALPALVDTLPDTSEAASTLREQMPALGPVLDVLKAIRTGTVRAAVLLLVIVLIVVLCLFRLPGLHGLRCVGICCLVSAALTGAIYLLLGMPALQTALSGALKEAGAIITEFASGFAHEFAVCAVIYGVCGLVLVLGTTVLRTFFSAIFYRR